MVRTLKPVLAATLVIGAISNTSLAQCQGQWQSGMGVPGLTGTANAATYWDPDGPGPRSPVLVVGGSILTQAQTIATAVLAWDGAGWVTLGSGDDRVEGSARCLAVAPDGSLYVAGSIYSPAQPLALRNLARWDGSHWTWPEGLSSAEIYAMTWLPDGDLVIGGSSIAAQGLPSNGIARWNGSQWVGIGGGIIGRVLSLAVLPNGDLVAGGGISRAGTTLIQGLARWDGQAWTSLGNVASATGLGVQSLLPLPGGDLVAGGTFLSINNVSALGVAHLTPEGWQAMGSSLDANVRSVKLLPNGDIIAGGSFAFGAALNNIARWNGSGWTTIAGGCDAAVNAIALDPTDASGARFAAAGIFTSAGQVGADDVALWEADHWACLGRGINKGITSMLIEPNGDLIAGGRFKTIDGSSANYIARRTTAGWEPMGQLPGPVLVLRHLPSGGILAAYYAIDDPVYSYETILGRWDGSQWVTLAHVVGPPYDILVQGENTFVVAGRFISADGVTLTNLARFDAGVWSQVGPALTYQSGVAGVTRVVQLGNGDLVVTGTFQGAAGLTLNSIARWDGASWHAYGSGLLGNQVVGSGNALAIAPDGSLVVGGYFTSAGGVAAYGLARWNGTSWQSLSTDPAHTVTSIAFLPGGDMVVGALFPNVQQVNRVSGSTWTPIGGSLDGSVSSITPLTNGGLFASGDFRRAGGHVSNKLATFLLPTSDFNNDGDAGTDADIETFFACLAGSCCPLCGPIDFNGDGDVGTDADIESFFRVLAGGPC